MSQHLQFELRTVRAALGAQPIDARQPIAALPGADLLLGLRPHRRASSCAPPSPAKKLRTSSSLNSVPYFFMKPLEVRPTSGGQFKPWAIQSAALIGSVPTHVNVPPAISQRTQVPPPGFATASSRGWPRSVAPNQQILNQNKQVGISSTYAAFFTFLMKQNAKAGSPFRVSASL